MSDLKQEYLNAKYADYDDESDVPYKHKRKHNKPKKSKHKHEYENVVIVDHDHPDSFRLLGRCKECGKVGGAQRDHRIDKKFPNIIYEGWRWFIGCRLGHEKEYEDFKEWCKKHYNTIDKEFDVFKDKYI